MTSRVQKIFRFGAVELRFDWVTRFLEPDPNSSTHLYRRKALGTHNTQKLEEVVDASPSDDEQIQHYKRRNFRREFNFIAFAYLIVTIICGYYILRSFAIWNKSQK